jgi:uncharacterized protein (PEP-CTERM system associated)
MESSVNRLKVLRPSWTALAVATCFCANAQGQELTITGGVDTSLIFQNIEDETDSSDRESIQLVPTVSLQYSSKKLAVSGTVEHTNQRVSYDDDSRTDNFTEYSYSASLSAIDDVLSIQNTGAQRYNSTTLSSYLVSDFLLDSEDLAKVTSNQTGVYLTVREGNYFGTSASASYYTVTSDRTVDSATGDIGTNYDSDGVTVLAEITSGDYFRQSYWSLDGSYVKSNGTTNTTYKSTIGNAEVGYNLIGDFGVIVSSTYEGNEIESATDDVSADTQFTRFTTYGLGVSYRPSSSRYISLTANKIVTDGDDDGKNFLGIDLSWQFSSRTAITANFWRRYYGNSASASLSYGTRTTKSKLSYSETVTTYSQLLTSVDSVSLFVCDGDSANISECFQPDSSDYELEAGEEYYAVVNLLGEINEQVFLRKQLSTSIGFSRRRLTLALNLSSSENEYIDGSYSQDVKSATLNAGLQISNYSSIYSKLSYAHTESETTAILSENRTKIATLGLSRQFSRQLSGTTEFRYLTRDSSGLSTSDITERRFSVNVSYKFNQ